MSNAQTAYLADLLERIDLFSPAQVVDLIAAARESGMSITEIVAAEAYAPEEEFLEKLADVLHLPYVRLNSSEINQDVLDRLPTKAVFQYSVIPVSFENNTLLVASNNPLDAGLVDSLRLASGGRVKLALSPTKDIAKAAKRFYGVGAETVDRMMQDDRFEVGVDASLAKVDVTELDQEASIVKFVNQIIWEAVQQGATDIHLEPMEEQLRIRYRVDGSLHQAPVPARLIRFQAAIISRIKVMANLDIAEKRMPMDGRIGLRVQGEDIDIRVSTMPTVYGESVSLRLLQRKGEFIGLDDLGMTPRDHALIEKCIRRPNGIVLVTGPTGSGKSTSLYAFLHEINKIDRRILTAEEPIEYEMGGINQVLVRPDIGLTFARTLRSFLRQDPDIIMVGEIRDAETAEIAIQASLTGHLVFSTLHTNDAAGSFTRLLDMGVEPFLVASAVAGVVAQRLVRRLCRECRKLVVTDTSRLEELGFPVQQVTAGTIYEPDACETCRMTGFQGRGGIFEVLQVTEAIEALVVAQSSSHDIRQRAVAEGMKTLRDDGWQKVLSGFTTVEEVLRVTEENQ
ncbi:MAG: type II/IV secretion system protein [Lentisphaerae bacterium]|nr:type II/IV secretion system protein [Lentisphaerota bacterium]